MITIATWKVRFPEYASVTDDVFNLFLGDAVLEMGDDETRWIGFYDVAISYLVAHLVYLSQVTAEGDANPATPLRSTEVDDVIVAYAVSKTIENSFDMYLATAYGQKYIYYRRLAFAGPRIAFS